MNDPEQDDALGALIRGQATRHPLPPGLAQRVADGVRAAAGAPGSGRPGSAVAGWARMRQRRGRLPTLTRGWASALAFGAGAVVAGLAVLAMAPVPGGGQPAVAIADELVAGHVRSLMAEHLADVRSSDRHTVKPWFAGKLDYSPPVADLADQGALLVGGRLDYVGGRAVAALAYRSGNHLVNLYVWPAPGAAGNAGTFTRQGWHGVGWTQGGMQAWAVSDAGEAELQAFAARVRRRWAAPAPAP